MIDVAILKLVGFSAVAALIVGWLVTSFLAEGRGRQSVARLSFHRFSIGKQRFKACAGRRQALGLRGGAGGEREAQA